MVTSVTWQSNQPATPELIEPLLDDMIGKGNSRQIRQAVKRYCAALIAEINCTMGELNGLAAAFCDGYQARFVNS